jgi:hypothetical protein
MTSLMAPNPTTSAFYFPTETPDNAALGFISAELAKRILFHHVFEESKPLHVSRNLGEESLVPVASYKQGATGHRLACSILERGMLGCTSILTNTPR